MTEERKEAKAGMLAQAAELLGDPLIDTAVALDALLAVALGRRDCALVVLPVALPDGGDLGRAIDLQFTAAIGRRKLRPSQGESARLIAEAFDRLVLGAPTQLRLMYWIEELGLLSASQRTRPSVVELYVFREKETATLVEKLFDLRNHLRQDNRRVNKSSSVSKAMFPEEFDAAFLFAGADLLGYPPCCSAAYARDRTSGSSVEQRAAHQALSATGDVHRPFAYFAADFFPCRPTCPAASKTGTAYHAKLGELSPELAARYEQHVSANRLHVIEYPERIRQHELELRRRGTSATSHRLQPPS